MFPSSVRVAGSIFIYGGFNEKISSGVNKFTPPVDPCSRFEEKTVCIAELNCHWCHLNRSPSNASCMSAHLANACNRSIHNSTFGRTCIRDMLQQKPCSSYQSCHSCLSEYPPGRSQCQWCRCTSSSVCQPRDMPCGCVKETDVDRCYESFCETSTCKNCGDAIGCFWSHHLAYLSENTRSLHEIDGVYSYNCFSTVLYQYLSQSQQNMIDQDRVLGCPQYCASHKTCSQCLGTNIWDTEIPT